MNRLLTKVVGAVVITGVLLAGLVLGSGPSYAGNNNGYATTAVGALVNGQTYAAGGSADQCFGKFSCADEFWLVVQVLNQVDGVVASNGIMDTGLSIYDHSPTIALYNDPYDAIFYGCGFFQSQVALYDISTNVFVDINRVSDC